MTSGATPADPGKPPSSTPWSRNRVRPLASRSRHRIVPSVQAALPVLTSIIVGIALAWSANGAPIGSLGRAGTHKAPAFAEMPAESRVDAQSDRSDPPSGVADQSDATPDPETPTTFDVAESTVDGEEAIANEQSRPSGAVAAQASDPKPEEVVPDRDPEVVTMPDGTRFSLTSDGGGRGDFIRVQDRDNQRVRSAIGTSGSNPGEFLYPCALAPDPDGNIVVADFGNGRVQVLTAYGAFVRSFGAPGIGPGEMLGPCGLAVDAQGRVYVADALSTRVQLFDQSGRVTGQWGSATEDPFAPIPDEEARVDPGAMLGGPVKVTVTADTLVVVRHPDDRYGTDRDPQWRYRLDDMTPPDALPAVGPPVHAVEPVTYEGFIAHANRVPAPYIDRIREIYRDPSGFDPEVYFSGAFLLNPPTAPERAALLTALENGGTYGYCDFDVWRPGERKPVWSMNRPGHMYPTDRPATFAIASRFAFQNEAHGHERLQYMQFFEWDGASVHVLPYRRVGEWRLAVHQPGLAIPDRVPWPVDDDPTWVPWADDAPEALP